VRYGRGTLIVDTIRGVDLFLIQIALFISLCKAKLITCIDEHMRLDHYTLSMVGIGQLKKNRVGFSMYFEFQVLKTIS
jgi:hypothetical protein